MIKPQITTPQITKPSKIGKPRAGKIATKAKRLSRSLLEGQARPDDLWALARLSPAESRVYLRLDARDREHAVRVAQALAAAYPQARGELLAAALLHDCGKARRPYRVWERVCAGLLPLQLAAWLPWGAAQSRFHHPTWGAAMLREAGGRAEVAQLVALHHTPSASADAALLHAFDDLE